MFIRFQVWYGWRRWKFERAKARLLRRLLFSLWWKTAVLSERFRQALIGFDATHPDAARDDRFEPWPEQLPIPRGSETPSVVCEACGQRIGE